MRNYVLTLLIFAAVVAGSSPVLAQGLDNCFGQYSGRGPKPDNPCQVARCYREYNGRGEIVKWAKTEYQCRHQSNGRSWGYPGVADNIYRDPYDVR